MDPEEASFVVQEIPRTCGFANLSHRIKKLSVTMARLSTSTFMFLLDLSDRQPSAAPI